MEIGILEENEWFSQKAMNSHLGGGIFLGSFFESLTAKHNVYNVGIDNILNGQDIDILFCCIDPCRFFEDGDKLLKISDNNIIIGFSDLVDSHISCHIDQYIEWSKIWRPVLNGYLDFASVNLFDIPTWQGLFLANVNLDNIVISHNNVCTLAHVLRAGDCHQQMTTLNTISTNGFNSTAYSFEGEYNRYKDLENYITGLEVRPYTSEAEHYEHIKECYAVVQISAVRSWGTVVIKCLRAGKPCITMGSVWQQQLYPDLIVHTHEELTEKLSISDYNMYIEKARQLYHDRYEMKTNYYRAIELVEKIYGYFR